MTQCVGKTRVRWWGGPLSKALRARRPNVSYYEAFVLAFAFALFLILFVVFIVFIFSFARPEPRQKFTTTSLSPQTHIRAPNVVGL